MPFLVGDNYTLARESGVTAFTHILRSESTGSIHVSSNDAKQAPKILFNFLSAQLDRDVTVEAMRFVRALMTAPPLQGIATDEITPGIDLQSDDELLDWTRENGETTYHPGRHLQDGHGH